MENWVEKVAEEYVRHLTSMKEETGNVKFVDVTGKEEILTPEQQAETSKRITKRARAFHKAADLAISQGFGKEGQGKVPLLTKDEKARAERIKEAEAARLAAEKTRREQEEAEGEAARIAAQETEEETKKKTAERVESGLKQFKEPTNEELNWVNTLRESYIKEIALPCNNSENKNENE